MIKDLNKEAIGYQPEPESPSFRNHGGINLKISHVIFLVPRIEFQFHLTYLFTYKFCHNYHNIEDTLNLLIHDCEQQDSASIRTKNGFIIYPRGYQYHGNYIDNPPPIPKDPDIEGEVTDGGWINGKVAFSTILPKQSPSIFVYALLETYVSNVVGIDLLTAKPVEF